MNTPQSLAARLCTVLVALVAMALSYHALALRAGQANIAWPLAWVYPLAVDGLLAIGMLAGYVLRRAPVRTRAYVWGVIGLGLGISLLGNALAGDLRWDLVVIRAMPPLALAVTLHLLIVLSRDERIPRARRAAAERSPEASTPARPAGVLQLPEHSRTDQARALLAERPDISVDELMERTKLSRGRVRDIRRVAQKQAQALASG